jgi:aryl-alcohol dehydrogenase-like predicted oxidoreductase
MKYRALGRTSWQVSSVSFGSWAIGGTWGKVDDSESLAALRRAVELGVTFFDTADVYGDGRSERLLAKLKKECGEEIHIATKAGRRLDHQYTEGYNRANLEAWVERSLKNLETDCLDLLQLHCPPTEVYYMPEVFGILDDLHTKGKLRYYGVSVEKVEEGLKALEYPNVQTIQIIFNLFRQRPADLLFEQAKKHGVGILARVPLSSGMLTGKLKIDSKFAADDHRAFNREGAAFDRGETFSGVEYETGLKAVEELKKICPQGMDMAQFALRWILMFDAVSCAIPGAKRPSQAGDNIAAADLPALSQETMQQARAVYDKFIQPLVHQYW